MNDMKKARINLLLFLVTFLPLWLSASTPAVDS